MNVVYVTGNAQKAKYFADMMGVNIDHVNVDVDEIQSLDLREVVEHKARAAYEIVGKPVVVEDTKLVFKALGQLPGTLIKWFIQEMSFEELCRLLDGKDRTAFAGAAMAYYDGTHLQIFERELEGSILHNPSIGESGFGWNAIFRPKGASLPFANMTKVEFQHWYAKVKPFDELRAYLDKKGLI